MSSCYCDYDQPEFWSRTTPKARKRYTCEECGGPILPGERYEYIAGKWDGSFGEFKTCERCADIRQWVTNNVPCFCWSYGNVMEDAYYAIKDAVERAPTETGGLWFGFLRRKLIRDKHNQARVAAS